jgi:hypothetical protein
MVRSVCHCSAFILEQRCCFACIPLKTSRYGDMLDLLQAHEVKHGQVGAHKCNHSIFSIGQRHWSACTPGRKTRAMGT